MIDFLLSRKHLDGAQQREVLSAYEVALTLWRPAGPVARADLARFLMDLVAIHGTDRKALVRELRAKKAILKTSEKNGKMLRFNFPAA